VSDVYVGFHTLPCFDRDPCSTEVIEDDKGRRGEQEGQEERKERTNRKERRTRRRI